MKANQILHKGRKLQQKSKSFWLFFTQYNLIHRNTFTFCDIKKVYQFVWASCPTDYLYASSFWLLELDASPFSSRCCRWAVGVTAAEKRNINEQFIQRMWLIQLGGCVSRTPMVPNVQSCVLAAVALGWSLPCGHLLLVIPLSLPHLLSNDNPKNSRYKQPYCASHKRE